MEGYRNKVANLLANQSQIISKLLVNFLQTHSRGCISPPRGGCHGAWIRVPTDKSCSLSSNFSPFGCHGSHGNHTSGGWPKGPMAPLCWGGRYTRERLAGVEIFYLGVPHSDPPRMAPLILGVSLVIRYRFLPIFRTFLGDFYHFHVVIRMTTCFFFRIRPPGE
jgi:hypothetical protein